MAPDSPQSAERTHGDEVTDTRDEASTAANQDRDSAADSSPEGSPAEAPSSAVAVADQPEPEPQESKSSDDAWQAVFSAEANAWYFWNSLTNETTWSNPRQSASASTDPAPEVCTVQSSETQAAQGGIPPIDPELAWLDPSAARAGAARPISQTARFNARTGRFQADPSLNPDRISDFQRGQRQQEAFYDVRGWENALAGQGIKRSEDSTPEGERKRPSAKELERFRQAKEEKKRRKVASWLAS